MPAGTARGQTSQGAAASTGLPHRQPRGYGEPPAIDLDETLDLIEIHLVVVFEDLEGHARGLRRAREGRDVRNVRVGRGADRSRTRTGALTLTASTNIFPPATDGVSTPPMKGSLRDAWCVESAGWSRGERWTPAGRSGRFFSGGGATRVSYSLRLVVRSMVISTANLAVSSYPSPPEIFVWDWVNISHDVMIRFQSWDAYPNLGAVFSGGVKVIVGEELGADVLGESIAELQGNKS